MPLRRAHVSSRPTAALSEIDRVLSPQWRLRPNSDISAVGLQARPNARTRCPRFRESVRLKGVLGVLGFFFQATGKPAVWKSTAVSSLNASACVSQAE